MEEEKQVERCVSTLEKKQVSRKDFLKLTAVTGAALVASNIPKMAEAMP